MKSINNRIGFGTQLNFALSNSIEVDEAEKINLLNTQL